VECRRNLISELRWSKYILTVSEFTKDRPRREIEISISASIDKPISEAHGVSFIKPRETTRDKQAVDPEWANLPTVYIQFAVEDTGRGLSEKEMAILFQRFSQASPKTYSQYGGSGLGLFVSKELTELSGGQIGVSSMGKIDYIPAMHHPLMHFQQIVDLCSLSTSPPSSYRQAQSLLALLLHTYSIRQRHRRSRSLNLLYHLLWHHYFQLHNHQLSQSGPLPHRLFHR